MMLCLNFWIKKYISSHILYKRRCTSTRLGRVLLIEWVCWVPSWIGRVIYSSGTESCYLSRSSAPWWTMRVPRGGLLPAPMSGGYRCYNPNVFASLLVPLVRNQQADAQGSERSAVCRPQQSPDRELWLKVSWYGEPPSTATRQVL
jgi:hypothetical protein